MKIPSDEKKHISLIKIPQILKYETKVTESEKDEKSLSSHTTKSSLSCRSFERDILPPIKYIQTLSPDADVENLADLTLAYNLTKTSPSNKKIHDPSFEVVFGPNDPENPRSWPLWYRIYILVSICFGSLNVVVHSATYTRSLPGVMNEFHLKDKSTAILGMTTYLLGIASGSLFLAPLSEIYGRRPVYIVSMFIFCLLFLSCATGKSLLVVVIGRYFSAFAGSVMVSNSPGSITDNFTGKHRPLALGIWSLAPLCGSVVGFLAGGFVKEHLSWRWNSWIVMISSVIAWIMLLFVKETYMPILVKKKVIRLRKETGDSRWWSRYAEELNVRQKFKVNLSRPFILAFTEPILWFWNFYIAVVYTVLYLSFIAYPIVYGEIRHWSPSLTGFGFVGIGVGTIIVISSEFFIRYYFTQSENSEKNETTAQISITLVCVASILCPLGQLWFSWTSATPSIHWVWPVLSSIPFGAGICLVLVHGTNYLAESYSIYSASALAGNVVVRNLVGGLLPLAGTKLYDKLGPQWAGSIIGLVMVLMIPLPFTFYKWGHIIQAKSPAIKRLKSDFE